MADQVQNQQMEISPAQEPEAAVVQTKAQEAAAGADDLRDKRGIRPISILLSAATVLVSALLLFANLRAGSSFTDIRSYTDHYISWQEAASDLQIASDYLTEQVRCFTETGDTLYLDNYFEEAQITRRRDKALDFIKQSLGDSSAYKALEAAMRESTALMNREYYAMRLTIAAYDYDIIQFPAEIQNTRLLAEDLGLSTEEMQELARSMVFDQTYREKKEAIAADLQDCLKNLQETISVEQQETTARYMRLLQMQRVLTFAGIAVMVLATIASFRASLKRK